jgi:Galactose mutarotase and related enzymes
LIALSDGNLVVEVHEAGAYVAVVYDITGVEWITKGDPSRPTKAGMAFLAPYANRVRGASYEFEDVRYELPRNSEGHAIHGLLLTEPFEAEDMDERHVVLRATLRHAGYPTELLVKVKYEVMGSLRATATFTNVGKRNAPLVVGWHPYFAVAGQWMLTPEGAALRCESENKIPTGRLASYSFGKDGEYDDCFLIQSGRVELKSELGITSIKSDNMKFFQVYTGVKGAVAVEPMSGAPDAFHNGLGLVIIRPGETREFSFEATFTPSRSPPRT